MSSSPTIKKIERITYINKLINELENINKQNDLIIAQIPNQIQDSCNIINKFNEHVEDFKPMNQKNLSKSNYKLMELEKSINQLKTKLKDSHNRTNTLTNQKELERELQLKLNQLDELRKKSIINNNNTASGSTTSTLSTTISNSPSTSSNNLTNRVKPSTSSTSLLATTQIIQNNNNINSSNESLKLIKSDLKSLIVSIQKIYQCTTIFYQTFKNYFNTLGEVSNRIPNMRGGIDFAGVLQIGGDEATEILERMNESIYQSSKIAWSFFDELPMLEKSWYDKNYKVYQSIIEKTKRDSSISDTSSNGSSNGGKKKKSSNIGIMNVLKKLKKKNTLRGSINLLEKITIMESENQTQQKLNQSLTNNSPPLNSRAQSPYSSSNNNNSNTPKSTGVNKKVIVYEPINSSCTLLDAIILDLEKLLSFPEKEIISHIDSLEKKTEMLIEIFELLKLRYQYFREKLSRWYENNSAILRVTSYEADPESFKIQDFKSIPDVQYKVKVLYKVMLSYFTTCLIATPMVYLSPDSWKLSNHSDYRQEKRKEIEKLLLILKANYPIDLDILRKLILEFTDILISALDIQIPLMLEVYEDDSTLTKRKNWSVERKLLKDTISKSINQLKYFQPSSLSSSFGISNSNNNNLVYQEMLGNSVQMIQGVMLHFFRLKPIGRPHIYRNDKEWKLISESKKRYEYRTSILI